MFAAHALASNGVKVVEVISKKRKSHMYGAQYLHAPIPGLAAHGTVVKYSLRGTVDQYREKVYGGGERLEVSPSVLQGYHQAFDIRKAYDDAWNRYQNLVYNMEVKSGDIDSIADEFDVVISTIPRSIVCKSLERHTFHSQAVWAIGDASDRDQWAPVPPEVGQAGVICNGEEYPSWYRASRVFEHATVEWPFQSKPPIPGVAEVFKPTGHSCDCYGDMPWIAFAGRYGSWEKGELSHHAYNKAELIANPRG